MPSLSISAPLYHHIKHKILVIGPPGCGKTSLIESLLARSKCPFEYHPCSTSLSCDEDCSRIKQCSYSQSIPFHEIEVELKVFERTVSGALERCSIQPYYHQLDSIIGLYDMDDQNFGLSFQQLQMALDSILALYPNNMSKRRPTVYVLGMLRDHRKCKQTYPYVNVRNYVDRIGAVQLFNYCYSSKHIKAFHYVLMLNVYRQNFRQQYDEAFHKAIENCRRHIYHDLCPMSGSTSPTKNIINLFRRLTSQERNQPTPTANPIDPWSYQPILTEIR